MNITNVLIQSAGSGGSFRCDPGIGHGTFSIIVSIFELTEVEVDPLWGPVFPMAPLQLV